MNTMNIMILMIYSSIEKPLFMCTPKNAKQTNKQKTQLINLNQRREYIPPYAKKEKERRHTDTHLNTVIDLKMCDRESQLIYLNQ